MQLPPVDRSPAQWRPQGADLYSTGASGTVPVRPVNAANPVESMDRLGEGAIVREPTRPTAPDEENRDWTLPLEKKDKPQEAEKPPADPPLYKQLLEFIQSMWRASANAVDVAQDIHKTALQERQAQQAQDRQSPIYSDPKVKRTGGS
ncbi:hypothetical protein [Alicycliphilus denitrificans]|uniref:hypothetical protein n=1 Tax=Alicycliphilus denitrificans TaxID=179636 RepID=UPI00384B4DC2